MSDNTATHALCPRCSSFQPVLWVPVEIAEVHADGRMGVFKGLEMKCRQCDFMITKVGNVRSYGANASGGRVNDV